MGRFSVVIPVYNEALVIYELLRRVVSVEVPGYEREVVIVDDGSSDDTLERVRSFINDHPQLASQIHYHPALINHGKGAALRAGFKLAKGDVILVQDGDLEYSPEDYGRLLKPFDDPSVHVVFGSRFMNGNPPGMKTLNLIANKILTFTTRFLYRQSITDEATGYKVFRRRVLERVRLESRGFEFCPEFTSKVLQAGYVITEVPISYNPRGVLEGKKIKARDGFIAIWWLIKLRMQRFFSGEPSPAAPQPHSESAAAK